MIVLLNLRILGKAEAGRNLHLIIRQVIPVTPLALSRNHHRQGQRVLARKLPDIVFYSVGIKIFLCFKPAALLNPEAESNPRIHHSLFMEHLLKILHRYVDIGEHLEIGPPADGGAGLFAVGGLNRQLLALLPADLALFKMKGILLLVTPYRHVHIFGGVLRRTGPEAVGAQGIVIVSAFIVFIFAPGVQLAEDQLPVPAFLVGVPVHGAAPPEVLHFNGFILKIGQGHEAAVPLPRLVNRVGENFKRGVLAALQAVRPEDDRRLLPDTLLILQQLYALISVLRGCVCH